MTYIRVYMSLGFKRLMTSVGRGDTSVDAGTFYCLSHSSQ